MKVPAHIDDEKSAVFGFDVLKGRFLLLDMSNLLVTQVYYAFLGLLKRDLEHDTFRVQKSCPSVAW